MALMQWLIFGLTAAFSTAKPCCPGNNLFNMANDRCDGYPEAALLVNCSDSLFMIDPNVVLDDTFTIDPHTGVLHTGPDGSDPFLSAQPNEYCITRKLNTDRTISVQEVAMVCFNDENALQPEIYYRYYIYSVCLLVSAVFLLITLIIYLLVPELRDLQGKCLMFSMLSLCIAYISLAILQLHSVNFSPATCVSQAFFTYFWMMAAFFWLNVVSYNVWRSVIFHHFRATDGQMLFGCCVYGWGGPLLFLVVALTTHHLPGPAETWTYFYGPVAVLLFCNSVFFVWTAWRLWKDCKGQSAPKLRCLRYKCLLYLKLFLVMGIPWIFELLSFIVDNSSGFWLVTDLLNCLQGLIIFLILVVFRKKALRGLVKNRPWGFNCPKKWAAGVDEESEGMLAEEEELSQTQFRT
ncbi:hypothetical protein C0J52_00699 [Blattella germanica]|nr:hypothetical protein C0J52_00699 [Blattella germanica]